MVIKKTEALVAVIMGSKTDWKTMANTCKALDVFDIKHTVEIISAHRTPDRLIQFAKLSKEMGYSVLIAGAGGAAHLPGMIAASTTLPVLGVPVKSKALNGIDSLLSIAQMPRGVAVGTLAIGSSGAFNAGLLAAQIIATTNDEVASKIKKWKQAEAENILKKPDPRKE